MNLWVYLLIVQFITFGLYGFDKRCARRQAARVPEYVLLLAGLLGGTFAAMAAMLWFRHKTRKVSFLVKFWGLTIVQILLLLFPPAMLKLLFSRVFV